MRELPDTATVIKELGGVDAVCRLTGRKYTAVWNWKDRGRFPGETFIVLQSALTRTGKTAPAHLWGMDLPRDASEERVA